MTDELKDISLDVGHRRVGHLMPQDGISVARTRKHRVATDCDHKFNIATNLLDCDFMADPPTKMGWRHESGLDTRGLAVSGCNLRPTLTKGHRLGRQFLHKTRLGDRGLNMAIAFRAPPEDCMHHRHHGSHYCSHDYQKVLQRYGFNVSMSGKGKCHDTAVVETFFKTIKAELFWRRSWGTRRQAEMQSSNTPTASSIRDADTQLWAGKAPSQLIGK